ncbi:MULTISPECIES: hypothetical protein [Microbacterium]|uniref:hypothetical protein n=1 Tax=Microbacterium TaxID=33882 RepID=UPI0010F51E7C|nr:hypothetical protein [Microbacterium sp. 4NA327F11]MCK9913899.1 hypothetical protein [Microbacteriaceae bacterium K1510]
MTTTTTTATDPSGEDYTSREGLRTLLHRLHDAASGAWEHDPVAAELMTYAADKYAPLARKHGLDPWEAASAAFDVMRTRAAREADDPWAVVTHAVRITCIAEERGQGLLCSVHQARRPHVSCFHDPERLSERENTLSDYHPAFHVTDPHHDDVEVDEGEPRSVTGAVEDAILLFMLLGWPEGTARPAIEHVCEALARIGSRTATYEALRRDRHARALLDVPAASWTVLLRVLLGRTTPGYAATGEGRGILLRLLIGESLPSLLGDDGLVATISQAAPRTGAGRRGA